MDVRKPAGLGAGACGAGGGFDLLRGYTGSVSFVFRHLTLAVVAAFQTLAWLWSDFTGGEDVLSFTVPEKRLPNTLFGDEPFSWAGRWTDIG